MALDNINADDDQGMDKKKSDFLIKKNIENPILNKVKITGYTILNRNKKDDP